MRQDGATKEYRVLARHSGSDQLTQRVLPTGFPSSSGYEPTTEDLGLAVRYAGDLESMDSIEDVVVEAREVGPWEPILEEDLPFVETTDRLPTVDGDPDVARAGKRVVDWP